MNRDKRGEELSILENRPTEMIKLAHRFRTIGLNLPTESGYCWVSGYPLNPTYAVLPIIGTARDVLAKCQHALTTWVKQDP